jgi:RNA polymerase sigma-70 factor (ECF subfamily)
VVPFQTTHWTVVFQAGQAESEESTRKAMAAFTESYWAPLYTFVRRRGYASADAQDIVQSFFVHLLEHNTLSRADQEKGRLRTFLLGALQDFLLTQHERRRALKRGGASAAGRGGHARYVALERHEFLRRRLGLQDCARGKRI